MPAQALVMLAMPKVMTIGWAIALVIAGTVDAMIIGTLLAPDDPGNAITKNTLVVKSAAEPHKIVYGRAMVGGTLILLDVLDRYFLRNKMRMGESTYIHENREAGKILHMGVAIAAHEIDAVEQVYIGDELVYELDGSSGVLRMVNSKYAGLIELSTHLGEPNQAYDQFIFANLDHHYRGQNSSDTIYQQYYAPVGVTAVNGNQITIDPNSRFSSAHPTPLQYEITTNEDNWDSTIVDYNGTYQFYRWNYNGPASGIPAGGIPWSTAHKLTNTAYLYLKFTFNRDVYDNGIPKVRAVIRGKKLYDPREDGTYLSALNDRGTYSSGVTYSVNDKVKLPSNNHFYRCTANHTAPTFTYSDTIAGRILFTTTVFKQQFIDPDPDRWAILQDPLDSSSWHWSDNWALALRDYLTSGNYYARKEINPSDPSNNLYGIGVKSTEVNDLEFIEAANISDEAVAYDSGTTVKSSSYTDPYLTIVVDGDKTDLWKPFERVQIGTTLRELIRQGVYAYKPEKGADVTQVLNSIIGVTNVAVYDSVYNTDTLETTMRIKYPFSPGDLTAQSVTVRNNRFTVNGVVDTGSSPLSTLENILACGAAVLPYVQGRYKPLPGVYRDPSIEGIVIDESWLAGTVTVAGSLGTGNVINTITGTFPSIGDLGEETDFARQTSEVYRAEDGGYELVSNVTYSLVNSNFSAQRLARISLQRARKQVQATLVCNLKALEVAVGDTVTVNIDRLGWVNEVFSIVSWSLEQNQIVISLRQEAPELYDWGSSLLTPIPFKPTTTFDHSPDLTNVTNLQATSGTATLKQLADGTIIPRILVTWTPPVTRQVSQYEARDSKYLELEIINTTDSNLIRAIEVSDYTSGSFYLEGYKEGDVLGIRARIVPRAVDSTDIDTIPYLSAIQHIVLGKSQPPAQVTGLTSSISEDMLVLSWDENTEIDFSHYKITDGVNTYVTESTEYIITGLITGTLTYTITAVDTSGNESLVGTTTQVTITPPFPIIGISQTILDTSIDISWTEAVKGSFSIAGYVVKYGADWASGTHVATVKATSVNLVDTWVGSRTYMVRTVDIYGNESAIVSANITVTAPSAPTILGHSFIGDRVEFTWVGNPGTFSIVSYEIKYDNGTGTFEDATRILITGTDAFSRRVDWGGIRRFWVAAIDTKGNVTANPATETITVINPVSPTVITQVIDNNVLLRWNDTATTLPINTYEVRRGDVYATSQLIGNISGLFSTIFETESGTYKYWVTPIDTAGNTGISAAVIAQVLEPPDYILITNAVDDFSTIDGNWISRTLTNSVVQPDGINLPVNTTETWAQHYSTNSWNTPQDQINASFPIYAQPTPASGAYEVIFDYGTTLSNMSVTLELLTEVVAGDGILTFTLSTSTDNISYTTFANNQSRIFSPAVRYVKVNIDVSSSPADTDIIKITQLDLRIDVKEKTDAGTANAVSTDPTGTVVNFNKAFVDITALTVTPKGNSTAVRYAVADFVDTPNPTGFSVYLYDSGGNRTSGPVSWVVRGI